MEQAGAASLALPQLLLDDLSGQPSLEVLHQLKALAVDAAGSGSKARNSAVTVAGRDEQEQMQQEALRLRDQLQEARAEVADLGRMLQQVGRNVMRLCV